MAAGVLSKPGSDFGPCEEGCSHTDCAETRTMAAGLCAYCGKPIGYQVRYYRRANFDPPAFDHARCLEDALDAASLEFGR